MKRFISLACGALFAFGAAATHAADAAKAEALLKQHNCTQCHSNDKKILGPAYKEVAKKYKGQKDAVPVLVKRVKEGSKGIWGPVPMPPNAAPSEADVRTMVEYLLAL